MRGLYSIHDYDAMEMSFAPFKTSTKAAATQATSTPSASYPSVTLNVETTIFGLSVTEFLIVVGLVILIVGIAVLIWILCFYPR